MKILVKSRLIIFCFPFLFFACTFNLNAQQSQFTNLSLDDASAFRPHADIWKIISEVEINKSPSHSLKSQPQSDQSFPKKKKKELPKVDLRSNSVSYKEGKGILIRDENTTKDENLLTVLEHGDIDIELEVMLQGSSNSGIYLQGRYKVQLVDSWGVQNSTYLDMGGINRNFEKDPSKSYNGKAPLSNSSKAPGLWQLMKISFRAPTFDINGNKVTNAKFALIELNGVKIHENIELPFPTAGSIENDEKSVGPLMFQDGDGSIAFRNIKYRLLHSIKAGVSLISYKLYKGSFKNVRDFESSKIYKSGKSSELTCEILEDDDKFGVIYSGILSIPEDNFYIFKLGCNGGFTFAIDSNIVIDKQLPYQEGWTEKGIPLKSGNHSIIIANFKDVAWLPPRLGLKVQANNSNPVILTAFNSYPSDSEPLSPITIKVGKEPKILRAFLDFKSKSAFRLTHAVGIGDPSGVNYVYDLQKGNIVAVWRGEFVDATPMWHDRGDGSFRPLGATQYLFINQPLAFLSNPNDAFPKEINENEFRANGYKIEKVSHRPIFLYTYSGIAVEDKIYPEDNGRIITHEISVALQESKSNLFYKLAEGIEINPLSDGSFVIDNQYYILCADAFIRNVWGIKELVIPVNSTSIKYSIIW